MSIEDKVQELSGYFHVLGKRMKKMDRSDPVLHNVGLAGSLTMSEIASAIGLSLSSATALVDKLEERKWVKRDRSEEDRRVVRVVLTGQGAKFYDLIEKMHLKLTRDILGTLDDAEQSQLLTLFRKIASQLDQP